MPRWLPLGAAVVLCAVAASPLAGAAPTATATVKVAYNAKLHKTILVDARGFSLYMYTADLRNKPTCYNDSVYHCSKAWLPLRSTGAPHAGAGVKASLLRLAKRTDGASQVTYNGLPLYTAEGPNSFGLKPDKKPGDVNGQGFAGIWYVVSPAGKPISKAG